MCSRWGRMKGGVPVLMGGGRGQFQRMWLWCWLQHTPVHITFQTLLHSKPMLLCTAGQLLILWAGMGLLSEGSACLTAPQTKRSSCTTTALLRPALPKAHLRDAAPVLSRVRLPELN